jgi:hypothetical protein
MGTLSTSVPDAYGAELEAYLEEEKLDRSTAVRKLRSEGPEENRDGQQFQCLDCSYSVNAEYNAAKNIARKLRLKLQRGQKAPAGGAFCQYALKSGTMTM